MSTEIGGQDKYSGRPLARGRRLLHTGSPRVLLPIAVLLYPACFAALFAALLVDIVGLAFLVAVSRSLAQHSRRRHM